LVTLGYITTDGETYGIIVAGRRQRMRV